MSARAPIVFLCASALETTRILLQTRTASGEVVGAQSGTLGVGLMDHVLVRGHGVGGALAEETEPSPGRCIYLSRFDLCDGPRPVSRGYGIQVYRWGTGR